MEWLLRGRGWSALVQEVAWAAVSATGEPPGSLAWVVPLVDERLGAGVREVRGQVEAAIEAARVEHVRRWPNDAGADTAAELAGRHAAEQALGRLYYATARWAAALVLERRAAERRRLSLVRRLLQREDADRAVVVEFPEFVIDRAADTETVGWPGRAAA